MFGVEPKSRSVESALAIYGEILENLTPNRLVPQAVKRIGDILFVHDEPYDLARSRRVHVCGAGKAAGAMAAEVKSILGDRCDGGIVVTQPNAPSAPSPIRTFAGGHPIPNEQSLVAGEAMLTYAESVQPDDLVIFCLSGGASAVLESLKPGVSLAELRSMTDAMLRAGADIQTMNGVRRRLSAVKAGGLARAFHCQVIVLVLSDVVGTDLSVVGSGPFMAPKQATVSAQSMALKLAENASPAVRSLLLDASLPPAPPIPHAVIGSASLIWPLAAAAAQNRGLEPVGYSDPLKGEARTMASRIVRLARARVKRGEKEFCMVFVGEPTVTVTGDGRGGRAQEMATQAAGSLTAERQMAFLAAATDGADGPTDAAGGVVDFGTVARARLAGQTVKGSLATNDTYSFLHAAGGLIVTGPTGTNVNDVVLVVHTDGA